MKEPTMTEFERAARDLVDALMAGDNLPALDPMQYETTVSTIASALTSHARPAAGWRKAEPGQTFEDGDLILCAVPLMPSGFDYCVLSVKCDDEYFRLDLDGEPWGWEWSDVTWWMPCPKAPAATNNPRWLTEAMLPLPDGTERVRRHKFKGDYTIAAFPSRKIWWDIPLEWSETPQVTEEDSPQWQAAEVYHVPAAAQAERGEVADG